jgi:hypothetical protein
MDTARRMNASPAARMGRAEKVKACRGANNSFCAKPGGQSERVSDKARTLYQVSGLPKFAMIISGVTFQKQASTIFRQMGVINPRLLGYPQKRGKP